MAKYKDITNLRFERLRVVEYYGNNRYGSALWKCECDCGNKNVITLGASLRSGHTKSCGCYNIERCVDATKKSNKKYNTYDLTGEYGIGYTFNGEEFYFDLEDYNKIKNYCWYKCKYIMCSHKRMHRIVIDCPKNKYIDHINHDTTDNRKNNLRICDQSNNMKNQKVSIANTSGVTGVSYKKQLDKWLAQIVCNNKTIYLGVYENIDDAIKVRLQAEKDYFGDFAPQKYLYEQYGIQ